MRKRFITIGLVLVLALALLMALVSVVSSQQASAHRWGTYDVSNHGRTAKVLNNLDHMRRQHAEVQHQLNRLAGNRGVLFRNTGEPGVPGVDWELRIADVSLAPGIGGTDYNYVNCGRNSCYSYSEIRIANALRGKPERQKKRVLRHEYLHGLSAPHEPCFMRRKSIMVGNPPCADPLPVLVYNLKAHDYDNYRYNRQHGVYDEPQSASLSSLSADSLELNRSNVEMWARTQGADFVRVRHQDNRTIVAMHYTLGYEDMHRDK